MPFKEISVNEVYNKDDGLKPEDVRSLQEWVEKQPHLPELSEFQVALFLQSCYYSNELAKITLDNYFTVKTLCPDIFGNRNPADPEMQAAMSCCMFTVLPELTPEGYTVLLYKLIDPNPDHFNFAMQCRAFDMITLLHLHKNGPCKGVIIVADMGGTVFGHLLKLGIVIMKKFMFYLQEALPIRLKSLEYINIVSFMDKIVALMKPFMKSELLNSLYLHSNLETLYERVPKHLLPQDYGGNSESILILHEKYKALMNDSVDFFKYQDTQLVNESKRPGKPKNIGDIFGVEGTFKKLEVD